MKKFYKVVDNEVQISDKPQTKLDQICYDLSLGMLLVLNESREELPHKVIDIMVPIATTIIFALFRAFIIDQEPSFDEVRKFSQLFMTIVNKEVTKAIEINHTLMQEAAIV